MSLEETIHSLSRQMAHRDKRARRTERTRTQLSSHRAAPCVTDWHVHTRLTDAASVRSSMCSRSSLPAPQGQNGGGRVETGTIPSSGAEWVAL